MIDGLLPNEPCLQCEMDAVWFQAEIVCSAKQSLEIPLCIPITSSMCTTSSYAFHMWVNFMMSITGHRPSNFCSCLNVGFPPPNKLHELVHHSRLPRGHSFPFAPFPMSSIAWPSNRQQAENKG